MRATFWTLAAAWLGLLLFSTSPTSAQLLTFVAATGNDANTCLVQANPCKTLQKAINVTAATGEVRILSQLQSNGFVNKSITIDGGGNTVVGTIAINSASAIVTLKNLSLNGIGGFATGINIIDAAAVHIEDSTVERYTGFAIRLIGNASITTELFVSNVIEREGEIGIAFSAENAKLTIVDSRFENNSDGGVLVEKGQASIHRSAFLNNGGGLGMTGGSTNVTESIAAGNSVGFGTSGGATATLDRCVASENTLGFENMTTTRVSDSTFTNNGTGILLNGGTLLTLGNNLIANNTTNIDDGPADLTLTPLAGF